MISISANVGNLTVGTAIASRSERQTDQACAAQDSAAEATSPDERRTPLDRLLDTPGTLDRFGAADG